MENTPDSFEQQIQELNRNEALARIRAASESVRDMAAARAHLPVHVFERYFLAFFCAELPQDTAEGATAYKIIRDTWVTQVAQSEYAEVDLFDASTRQVVAVVPALAGSEPYSKHTRMPELGEVATFYHHTQASKPEVANQHVNRYLFNNMPSSPEVFVFERAKWAQLYSFFGKHHLANALTSSAPAPAAPAGGSDFDYNL